MAHPSVPEPAVMQLVSSIPHPVRPEAHAAATNTGKKHFLHTTMPEHVQRIHHVLRTLEELAAVAIL